MTHVAPELERTMDRALSVAAKHRHEYATLEHFLAALVDDADAAAAMRDAGVYLKKLKATVSEYLRSELQALKGAGGIDPTPTSGFQRVIQRAVLHAEESDQDQVTGVNALLALFGERESYAVYFLQQQNMSLLDVISYHSKNNGASKNNDFHEGALNDDSIFVLSKSGGSVGKSKRNIESSGDDKNSQEVDFFISYASEDESVAVEVNNVIRGEGFTTIAQYEDFVTGTNFVREMQRGLKRSRRLVALYSPSYERSGHCQAEWSFAYNRDPGSSAAAIIPFLVSPTELSPLAQQVVYTPLTGLNKRQRKAAIIKAIKSSPRSRTREEVRDIAAHVASPDVALKGGRLDAIPNPRLDEPLGTEDLVNLPAMLRGVASTILAALPPNTPPIVSASIAAYELHLVERGARPIVGLLSIWADSVKAEFNSEDVILWGAGLRMAIEAFFLKHSLFISHYPASEQRERFFSETPVDENRAVGRQFEGPILEASNALREVSSSGQTTPEFDRIIESHRQQAVDMASMPESRGAKQPAIISVKRRFILTSIGFYERIISLLARTDQILRSPAVRAAEEAVRRAIDTLLNLVK